MKIAGTLNKPEPAVELKEKPIVTVDRFDGLTGKQRRNARKKEQRKRKKMERSQANISNTNITNDGASVAEDEDEAPKDIDVDQVVIAGRKTQEKTAENSNATN